jgi:hypothetical protein
VSPGAAVTCGIIQAMLPAAGVVIVVADVVVVAEVVVVVVTGVVEVDVVVVVVVALVVVVEVVVFATISMYPSTNVIGTAFPFSSVMNIFALSHVTGYFPAAQSSGTLNVSVNTFDPFAAV